MKTFTIAKALPFDFGKSYQIYVAGQSFWISPANFEGFEEFLEVADDEKSLKLPYPFKGKISCKKTTKWDEETGEERTVKNLLPMLDLDFV